MTSFFSKNAASRIIKSQNLAWIGSGTIVSTNFGPGIFHVRVISQIPGSVSVDNLGTLPTTAGGNGTFIAANTAAGDYFACTPGEVMAFSSTSTSSGTVSVTEMS